MAVTREELKDSLQRQDDETGQVHLDMNEVLIIVAALGGLTGGLVSGRLSETAYVGLMGTFLGYTFGRIFNHVQGKE